MIKKVKEKILKDIEKLGTELESLWFDYGDDHYGNPITGYKDEERANTIMAIQNELDEVYSYICSLEKESA